MCKRSEIVASFRYYKEAQGLGLQKKLLSQKTGDSELKRIVHLQPEPQAICLLLAPEVFSFIILSNEAAKASASSLHLPSLILFQSLYPS